MFISHWKQWWLVCLKGFKKGKDLALNSICFHELILMHFTHTYLQLHDKDFKKKFQSSRQSTDYNTPITPPHPPKRPRTMSTPRTPLRRSQSLGLSETNQSGSFVEDNRTSASAGGEYNNKRKERIQVNVCTMCSKHQNVVYHVFQTSECRVPCVPNTECSHLEQPYRHWSSTLLPPTLTTYNIEIYISN